VTVPTRFLIGTAADGPFDEARVTELDDTDAQARIFVVHHYGEILDVVDWTDDYGKPIALYIVAK
jgi:hypothetical protein